MDGSPSLFKRELPFGKCRWLQDPLKLHKASSPRLRDQMPQTLSPQIIDQSIVFKAERALTDTGEIVFKM